MPGKINAGELKKIYREGLLEDIIPWWQSRFIDREDGGYLTFRDADGSILSTDKPVWVLGRCIWMWSRLYNTVEKRREWLDTAEHGINFMLEHAFDFDGRMFFILAKDGRPLRKRRYLSTEKFATIALAEYARATGSESMLDRARELYNLTLRFYNNPGLLPPKVYPETRSCKSLGKYMGLIYTSQIMNEIAPDPLYEDTINRCIREIFGDFMKSEKKCVLETVLSSGKMLDTPEGRTVNPGHSIEVSWFIMEEYRRTKNRELLEQACRILEWSLDIGWDGEHGGILYFVDCDGNPPEQYEHELKLWWPHNEALYACLLAYYLTGEPLWEEWYEKIHSWVFNRFPDKKHGEWFGYLRRDGTISSTVKGNTWKGPFHLPRIQLYAWKLLEQMEGKQDPAKK